MNGHIKQEVKMFNKKTSGPVKTILKLETELHEWLKLYKKTAGRSIEWTVNQAVREFMERDNSIGDMAKQEGEK
jgi:hypothetical protein